MKKRAGEPACHRLNRDIFYISVDLLFAHHKAVCSRHRLYTALTAKSDVYHIQTEGQ